MKMSLCLVLAGTFMMACQPAMAGHLCGRYHVVRTSSAGQPGVGTQLVILDECTGTLWRWTEVEGTTYAGTLATYQPGSFARIIHVDR